VAQAGKSNLDFAFDNCCGNFSIRWEAEPVWTGWWRKSTAM